MQIIDTHCHYNLEPLYSGQAFVFKIKENDSILTMDWLAHWQNAQEKGVQKSIIVGPGLRSSQKAVEIAQSETNLYASVGIHPERANKISDVAAAIQDLAKLAENSKVVAIGETGLDYFYLQTTSEQELKKIKARQKDLFIGQIKLAAQLNLPLILHIRDHNDGAYLETLNLLDEHWSFQNSLIFHCVSGSLEYIKRALTLKNSYFGFDGNITFKNAQSIREIFALVQQTDPSKILLETDAPYLAPEPHRGKICEPEMITQTASYMERELGADLAQIYQNSMKAFDIN